MRSNALFCRHAALVFIAALAICMLGSSHAGAQQFQFVYGGPDCQEAGRYGVKQLDAGSGYIAVGETFSTGAPCGPSDAYVIITDPNGAIVTTFSYDIGGDDSATDVIEEPTGNFVICGVTDNAGVCGPSRDIFIMRIDPAGNVLGVNTFGSPDATTDETAWNLIQVADDTGDFILAGASTFNAGGGTNRDAYLLRVSNALLLVWDAKYGGAGTFDELFFGVEQVLTDGSSDIIAVGTTNSVAFGGYDVLMVRVDENSGGMITPLQNLAVHGGPSNDEGRAIIEVRSGPFTGDLVVAGISLSRPLPSFNLEIVMLRTTGNPCILLASQYAGDNAEGLDGAFDLKEDMFSVSDDGDVIVTGFTDFGDFGAFLPPNAFLQRFSIATMLPTGQGMWYGGNGIDAGWSVNNVAGNEVQTDGYIVAGLTTSPNLIAPDPEQLYLIKTDVALASGCNEMLFNFIPDSTGFMSACAKIPFEEIAQQCVPEVTMSDMPPGIPLCLGPRTERRGNGGNDGISGVESPAVISFTEGTVTSFPNPIAGGTKLNLRFDMKSMATAHVSVSDIVGRSMYETEMNIPAGSAMRSIETSGWASGSYIVRVTIGGVASTTRVVVIEQ